MTDWKMFPHSPFSLFGKSSKDSDTEESANPEYVMLADIIDLFFVSHPKSGQKEGQEHERVMYYYPETETVDKKTDITGFAEAIVNFTSSLTESNTFCSLPTEEYNYRYINSSNSREIVLVVERGEFLIGTCLNRCRETEYFPHLATVKAILIKTYETFRLFFGPLSKLLSSSDTTQFKNLLSRFFTPYLAFLRMNKIPLVDLFAGVDFVPLSNVDYLDVECLVTRCMEEFPEIQHAMFLYQTKLIEYSINKTDLIPVYQLLSQNLIPFSLQSELQPELVLDQSRSDNINRPSNHGSKCTGSFITGATADFLGDLSEANFPIVFLSPTASEDFDANSEYVKFELLAYRAMNATFCLFVEVGTINHSEYLPKLAEYLDSRMCGLASRIGDAVVNLPKSFQSDIPFHYVYFNPDSLSLRTSFTSSIALPQSPSVASPLPTSIYKLTYETFDHFAVNSDNDYAQIYVKADNDWWIVFKKMNRRILLLFIPSTPSSNPADICNTTSQILSHFQHMFIA
ncbi:vacuolar fusion protein CCZ1 like protein [Ditylenchus destructor]|nr:vacuolar fusion protein CCZ1 like protein [Ditylenchus destructor]